MDEPLASFRDLKGIGPATEARLHEAGIYTWEALAAAATALAAVRGNGDTLRDVANLVAARLGEEAEPATPRPPDGEHLEAFVVRLALTADGEPRRCSATHVRTAAEETWSGWAPGEVTRFVAEHAGVRPSAPAPAERDGADAPARPAGTAPSTDHLLVLDAGRAIGGTARDVDLVVTGTGVTNAGFGYRATLAARRLGAVEEPGGWTALATRSGDGSPDRDLALRFADVRLPPGVHRLRLHLEVRLPTATGRPPALTLAGAG